MKMRQLLAAGAVAMLMTVNPVWSAPGGVKGPNPNAPGQLKKSDAPEIDAASGTSAIALLAGALVLMRERARSRRS